MVHVFKVKWADFWGRKSKSWGRMSKTWCRGSIVRGRGSNIGGRGRNVMKIPSIILYKISLNFAWKKQLNEQEMGQGHWSLCYSWKQLESIHKAAGITKWKDFLGTFHICFSSTSFVRIPSMHWNSRHVSHVLWHSGHALWHSRHASHAFRVCSDTFVTVGMGFPKT